MSSFTSILHVTLTDDGKTWRLDRPFSYRIGSRYSRNVIKVPKGFLTDFASIPKFLFFLPYWAKYSKSPVLHDYLYQVKTTTRKQADDIFLEAMKVDWRNHRARYLMAYLEYLVVRWFAWLAWRND